MDVHEEFRIQEVADSIIANIYKELREQYPESFPALGQLEIIGIIKKAIRAELKSMDEKREALLEKLMARLNASTSNWWD